MVEPLIGPDLQDKMIGWRRDFHAVPELGFQEFKTSARVAELLTGFGLEVHQGIGGTGVVAVLQRGNGKHSIGLRADMDALPIEEINRFSHRSTNEGVMHACGHDGHMAMLLGAAKALFESSDIDGRVVFIFQPSEENGEGAPAMIKDGLLERFNVDEVYGIHNIPGMAVGTFATRTGPITASESLFEIEIKALGGHAALPHMGVDAIVVAAEIVGALQTIVSRKLNPSLNGVVSVTDFKTDGKRNVLPGKAILSGDARALTPEINAAIEAKMRQIVEGICLAHGVEGRVTYDTIFPATINAAEPTKAATDVARAFVGVASVEGSCAAKLFSEDFAHMAAARPACFLLIGNGTEGHHAKPLHSAEYDFCDEALEYGASFWVSLVKDRLKKS